MAQLPLLDAAPAPAPAPAPGRKRAALRARRTTAEAEGDDDAALARAPDTAPVVSDALCDKALLIHKRLCAEYHCPIGYFHDLDPVSELVSSLLSHRTRNADSGAAFKRLRERFPGWEDVIEARTSDVEAAIHGVRWPELKAPRIQEILAQVLARVGDLDLDFLQDMSVDDARAWLEQLSGVGPKTSAAVLSFSRLRMPALPVDSHHHRVAQRLGLIGPRVAVGPSHAVLRAQLPADWSAQQLYDNHEILMLHGQHVCFHRAPRCETCTVADICPSRGTRGG